LQDQPVLRRSSLLHGGVKEFLATLGAPVQRVDLGIFCGNGLYETSPRFVHENASFTLGAYIHIAGLVAGDRAVGSAELFACRKLSPLRNNGIGPGAVPRPILGSASAAVGALGSNRRSAACKRGQRRDRSRTAERTPIQFGEL